MVQCEQDHPLPWDVGISVNCFNTIVFWGSNVNKPLYSSPLHKPPNLFGSSSLCPSLLIGLILTCHRNNPSRLWERNPTIGSLPSERREDHTPSQHPYLMPVEEFWFTLHWISPSCAWPLDTGQRAGVLQLSRPCPKAHSCDHGMGSSWPWVRSHSPNIKTDIRPKSFTNTIPCILL